MSSKPDPNNGNDKKPRKWSLNNPAYLESEIELAERGARFVPLRKIRLRVAIREDMKQLLEEVSKQAVHDGDMKWLDGCDTHTEVHGRVARGLEFLRYDRSNDGEDADNSYSYEYGRDLVLDLAVNKVSGSKSSDDDIHACMIALIAAGKVQQAIDLARFAGALRCIESFVIHFETVELIPQSNIPVKTVRPITRHLHQYIILTTLQGFLANNEIPTKRKLCCAAFGATTADSHKLGLPKVSDSDFSKRLRGMIIAQIIPDEPRCDKQEIMGTTYKFDLDTGDDVANCPPSTTGPPKQGPLTLDEPLLPYSGNPEEDRGLYFNRDLTRIKEALGMVYDAILLQLQIPEPTTLEALDDLVRELALLGIELGCAGKERECQSEQVSKGSDT